MVKEVFISSVTGCPLLLVRRYSAYASAFTRTILSWLEARDTRTFFTKYYNVTYIVIKSINLAFMAISL